MAENSRPQAIAQYFLGCTVWGFSAVDFGSSKTTLLA
jgi:hypothetical protein